MQVQDEEVGSIVSDGSPPNQLVFGDRREPGDPDLVGLGNEDPRVTTP